MNSRNLMLLIAFGITMPQSLLAAESSCHDYPVHRQILNEGNRQITGGSHRTGTSLTRMESVLERQIVPGSAQQCIENILRVSKIPSEKELVRENTERFANYYFQLRKYKECSEILEAVLELLEPQDRAEYYDVIAVCYLLKNQERDSKSKANYLEDLTDLVDKNTTMTEMTKSNLVKVCDYVIKASKEQKNLILPVDPEVTLRRGLLNLLVNKKEESVKFNDQVVANFRRDIIFAPKSLINEAIKVGLEKFFRKKPDRYLSEEHAIAFEKGKELMLSGAVSLAREVGSSDDLMAIAIRWIKSMPDVPLDAKKQALLISALPENFRTDFSDQDNIINTSRFSDVFDALKKRGSMPEAIAFKRGFFSQGFRSGSKPGVEKISRYYLDRGDVKTALNVYKEALKPISDLNNKNTNELLIAYARITPLYEDLSKYKISESESVAIQTKTVYKAVKHNYDIHMCLELAEELVKSGWKLVEQGDSKAALKLYKSALDIREKNLPPESRILGSTFMDAGRAADLSGDKVFAELCFKKALKIFIQNPIHDDDDLKITVESYGSLLNNTKRYVEAEKLFAKLKAIK